MSVGQTIVLTQFFVIYQANTRTYSIFFSSIILIQSQAVLLLFLIVSFFFSDSWYLFCLVVSSRTSFYPLFFFALFLSGMWFFSPSFHSSLFLVLNFTLFSMVFKYSCQFSITDIIVFEVLWNYEIPHNSMINELCIMYHPLISLLHPWLKITDLIITSNHNQSSAFDWLEKRHQESVKIKRILALMLFFLHSPKITTHFPPTCQSIKDRCPRAYDCMGCQQAGGEGEGRQGENYPHFPYSMGSMEISSKGLIIMHEITSFNPLFHFLPSISINSAYQLSFFHPSLSPQPTQTTHSTLFLKYLSQLNSISISSYFLITFIKLVILLLKNDILCTYKTIPLQFNLLMKIIFPPLLTRGQFLLPGKCHKSCFF
ncbi:hypothetical protein VP01_3384g1 [Puccinia sorghi]|uniref:Uncharacterized protein n=1 Tax=Puccinia sorghi TaxID=27349 RepID=A0A0L6UYM3_9BASI|nr:hypothetical protein VP01_3384g1 [Puccinia sorghi]